MAEKPNLSRTWYISLTYGWANNQAMVVSIDDGVCINFYPVLSLRRMALTSIICGNPILMAVYVLHGLFLYYLNVHQPAYENKDGRSIAGTI